CAGVPARIFAATISCPSCTPKAATDDIKNLSGIHAGLPEGHGHLDRSSYIAAHTRVLRCAFPQEPLLVARLVTPAVVPLDAV
ncbi:MAG: hypothetical protein ACREYE_20300, partial [Gammaproteobacteria bacterium]